MQTTASLAPTVLGGKPRKTACLTQVISTIASDPQIAAILPWGTKATPGAIKTLYQGAMGHDGSIATLAPVLAWRASRAIDADHDRLDYDPTETLLLNGDLLELLLENPLHGFREGSSTRRYAIEWSEEMPTALRTLRAFCLALLSIEGMLAPTAKKARAS